MKNRTRTITLLNIWYMGSDYYYFQDKLIKCEEISQSDYLKMINDVRFVFGPNSNFAKDIEAKQDNYNDAMLFYVLNVQRELTWLEVKENLRHINIYKTFMHGYTYESFKKQHPLKTYISEWHHNYNKFNEYKLNTQFKLIDKNN